MRNVQEATIAPRKRFSRARKVENGVSATSRSLRGRPVARDAPKYRVHLCDFSDTGVQEQHLSPPHFERALMCSCSDPLLPEIERLRLRKMQSINWCSHLRRCTGHVISWLLWSHGFAAECNMQPHGFVYWASALAGALEAFYQYVVHDGVCNLRTIGESIVRE